MSYRQTRRVIGLSKLYQRGKTQIPRKVRELLQIKDGDEILYVNEDGKIIIERN